MLFASPAFADTNDTSVQKISISPDQLLIDDSGIYVILDQEILIPIHTLFYDEKGYSILQTALEDYGIGDRYTCPNGHPAPMGRGRCNNSDCPHYAGN